jgi:hypothetical protein
VRSLGGAPLSDIRVRLNGANSDRGAFWADKPPSHASALVARRNTQSDAQGNFFFPDLAAGHYELEASIAIGAQPQLTGVDVTAGPAATSTVISLEVGDAIEGRVESPEGRGLPSVLIQALPDGTDAVDASATLRAVSGPDGRFLIRGLENDRYQLVADPAALNRLVDERYIRGTLLTAEAGERAARIVLKHAAVLAGRVTTADGQPARDARVSAYVDGVVVDSVASDSLGNFKLTVPRGSRSRVAAEWTPTTGEKPALLRSSIDQVEFGRTDVILRLEP